MSDGAPGGGSASDPAVAAEPPAGSASLQDGVRALFLAGDLAAANSLVRTHLEVMLTDAAGCTLVAAVANALGRPDEALAPLERATVLAPDSAGTWQNYGIIQRQLGQSREAADSFRVAAGLDPASAEACYGCGQALADVDDLAGALGWFETAISRDPGHAAAHAVRGLMLYRLGQITEALAAYETAIGLDPAMPEPWLNLGVLYQREGLVAEALMCFETAIVRHPALVAAWSNRAKALRALGRIEEARDSFDRALQLSPDDPVLRFDRGLCRLLLGDYAGGWADYEHRLAGRPSAALVPAPVPVWQGGDPRGPRLLVTAEQGFGDAFQFVRYIRILTDLGATVTLQVPAPMLAILAPLADICTLTAMLDDPRAFDAQIALMSLPLRLGTDAGSIPADVPYLAADAGRVVSWGSRIGTDGVRIGIAWQGNPGFSEDATRSIPLAAFAPLAGLAGKRLISLQRRDGLDQLALLAEPFGIERLPGNVDTEAPFVDTAAILMHLDLVVTSDSAIAHLAGALGRPVWLLLPAVPDWRWLMQGESCPWYPTMRIFRQGADGWTGVFAEVRQALLRQYPSSGGSDGTA